MSCGCCSVGENIEGIRARINAETYVQLNPVNRGLDFTLLLNPNIHIYRTQPTMVLETEQIYQMHKCLVECFEIYEHHIARHLIAIIA